ncbi:Protein kinase-like domain protein [Drechmeria coniospora]|uniref:EKC/KEOPS complex subunit BUD32 n=1 Tax=Drechmeria coniospora TaxID=98403 RepID=A0A151GKR4_DRECN|nr:Protein kinase-like domain protein [Drechmeria coniospora]KYK57679.1 Protein kinase-like domain protein [Drechmeria coniospora]ODA79566.1 hypothetical protein RJ55_05160 [Drechmeria coniospora]
MELNQQSIHDVIHPTAAFSTVLPHNNEGKHSPPPSPIPWSNSWLNPKNRIDSLDPPANPLWRIDGCTAFGTQIYALPLFLDPIRPYRVDVFIPEPATLSGNLREVLGLDAAFYTRESSRISHLGIVPHVLRILQHWTSTLDEPLQLYEGLPFGSRIVFHSLSENIADTRITIAPTYYLERQMLSLTSLQTFWNDVVDFPPAVDIDDLEYVAQLHDSVCSVRFQGKSFIFKAITSYTKYLYHELRQLLIMPHHPNIISPPVHLVTKKCSFGSKVAVVGFTLENHTHGSLRDLIPFLQLHGQVSLFDKVKWSVQLAAALAHLRQSSRIFYPDLRLDNIVLSRSWDAIMIDFEQRGVWCEFAAPEVNAIDYVRLLAMDDEINPKIRAIYADIMTEILPGWQEMTEGEDYTWPTEGYNIPWLCLTETEREACEVYMLGRVLWCIFEAKSAPQRASVWLSYRWEPLVEFPSYTTTPQPIRELIDWCTRGRQPGLSKYIVRENDKLVIRSLENTGKSTAHEVLETARHWWAQEIQASESWIKKRAEGMSKGDWNENYYERPSLLEVHQALMVFQTTNTD